MSLVGKTAFISGGGQNIGRAIAIELARRGCNVVVNGLSNVAACEETAQAVCACGSKASVVMGDVGQGAVVKDIAAAVFEQFGTVDIVVNNAASRLKRSFLEMSEAEWQQVFDVALNAAFHTSRAFLPGMMAAGWGRIVNMTGILAIEGYSGGAAASAAKHGLWGLTKALAKEFGPKGVTVNAISPGPIRTGGRDAAAAQFIENQVTRIPLGRLGTPEDVAALAGFLCSVEGGFINGQMISSNGGATT
jgi:3-oxoacyl-[acyl-carrier protein] reductase